MDKYVEADIMKRVKAMVLNNKYKDADALIESLEVDKIRDSSSLCLIGEVYMNTGKQDEAEKVLLRAFDRSPKNRWILSLLTNLYIKMENYGEAEYYYKEFINVASRDIQRYVLRYRIDRGKGEKLNVQIDTLERLKDYEYIEEWAYELARLYKEAGENEKCIRECNEIMLWFGSGEYADKAARLKAELTGEEIPEEDIVYPAGKIGLPAGASAYEDTAELTDVVFENGVIVSSGIAPSKKDAEAEEPVPAEPAARKEPEIVEAAADAAAPAATEEPAEEKEPEAEEKEEPVKARRSKKASASSIDDELEDAFDDEIGDVEPVVKEKRWPFSKMRDKIRPGAKKKETIEPESLVEEAAVVTPEEAAEEAAAENVPEKIAADAVEEADDSIAKAVSEVSDDTISGLDEITIKDEGSITAADMGLFDLAVAEAWDSAHAEAEEAAEEAEEAAEAVETVEAAEAAEEAVPEEIEAEKTEELDEVIEAVEEAEAEAAEEIEE
ncbi:MAG: hypothetical protein IJM62_04780, partial [Lachnospiraceae bacterium]|nr:hypothetical protein [Lachnospiraceae bacterium]